jgi:DNA modification methylase
MTELIWDGKYKDGKKTTPVKIALPFQTIETVNESAADRAKNLDMFAAGQKTEWRNRLIWGDKKYVLPALLPEFAGKVNLIYIDPPFDTGADFSFTTTIPDSDESFHKEPSIIEQKAYRDTWGRGLTSWNHWFYDTCIILRDLLNETGMIFVHLDNRKIHYAKVIMDEIFGEDNFRNQIVWKRTNAHGNATYQFGQIHDTILSYSKSESALLNQIFVQYDEEYIDTYFRLREERTGRRYTSQNLTNYNKDRPNLTYEWKGHKRTWLFSKEKMAELDKKGLIIYSSSGFPRLKQYLDESPGIPLGDFWADIKALKHSGSEVLPYPTQKPEALLERIISAASNPNDLVLDCFCGSGTTAAVAEKLGRRWIACDLGRFAIHTTRKRLLQIERCKPFIVQNLGKYERQAWQAAEFEQEVNANTKEEAYKKFILELYHAEPVSGHIWLHGIKGGKMVHVGSVDAPVTVTDVKSICAELWRIAGQGKDSPKELAVDILGWDFAFEVNEIAKQIAAEAKVKIHPKYIPREVMEKQAVEAGDIKFFELSALSVNVKTNKKTVSVELKDFTMPVDDIPAEVRSAIKHWSQFIDYWAIDWDYKNDTFHNMWQSYRTKKNPALQHKITNTYETPGKYTILVKVIDILGNDTTKAVEIEVK